MARGQDVIEKKTFSLSRTLTIMRNPLHVNCRRQPCFDYDLQNRTYAENIRFRSTDINVSTVTAQLNRKRTFCITRTYASYSYVSATSSRTSADNIVSTDFTRERSLFVKAIFSRARACSAKSVRDAALRALTALTGVRTRRSQRTSCDLRSEAYLSGRIFHTILTRR